MSFSACSVGDSSPARTSITVRSRGRTPGATDAAILTLREQGLGILKIGRKLRCGTARVQATLRAAS
jgi:hypothetical protein